MPGAVRQRAPLSRVVAGSWYAHGTGPAGPGPEMTGDGPVTHGFEWKADWNRERSAWVVLDCSRCVR
jgi:hypothetical protein